MIQGKDVAIVSLNVTSISGDFTPIVVGDMIKVNLAATGILSKADTLVFFAKFGDLCLFLEQRTIKLTDTNILGKK